MPTTAESGVVKPLIEVCVGSVTDAILAEKAGADRLELCSALELGGLTPSLGMVRACVERVQIPLVVMVRPRAGGFCYDEAEFDTMRRDIDLFLEANIDGVVFGILTSNGAVDEVRCRELANRAVGKTTVFHRAFDFLDRPEHGLRQLIDMGFTRLLTSGGHEMAISGADQIRRCVEDAAGRIEILPAGGIRPNNIEEILRLTTCTQAHVGASTIVLDPSLGANQILLSDPRCLVANRHRRLAAERIPKM